MKSVYPELFLSQIPEVVHQLQATGRDSSFAVLCFPSPDAPTGGNPSVNLQFAIEGGLLGLEWVLIGERNIEDRQRVAKFIEGEGYTVAERELNQCGYLRVEDGDLAKLGTRIITQCYGYADDSTVSLVANGFMWDGKYRRNKNSVAAWNEDLDPDHAITLESIDHFKARGMQNVYGRGDHFGGNLPVFHLDLWKTTNGRLLARFWSRRNDVGNESHEVVGYGNADFPSQDERWVPEVLRREYDEWITANW